MKIIMETDSEMTLKAAIQVLGCKSPDFYLHKRKKSHINHYFKSLVVLAEYNS